MSELVWVWAWVWGERVGVSVGVGVGVGVGARARMIVGAAVCARVTEGAGEGVWCGVHVLCLCVRQCSVCIRVCACVRVSGWSRRRAHLA